MKEDDMIWLAQRAALLHSKLFPAGTGLEPMALATCALIVQMGLIEDKLEQIYQEMPAQ